jgi:membrane-bound ClpP family serine protease
MFSRVLEAFLNPYWTTVWMYRILFGVGVAAFVVAAVLAVFNANLPAAALFGGLGVVAFLTYFVSRPLQALEENLQFITWLGIIYNTYWTRLVFAQNPETFQQECEQATVDAIAKIKELLDKHAERSSGRPGLR